MKKNSVIEPDHFACVRMSCKCRANGPRSQAITFFPFNCDPCAATLTLHNASIGSLKNSRPGKSKTITEIPHVHDPLLFEALDDRMVEAIVDLATIGDWSFSSVLWRSHTEKEDFSRPGLLVGILVVQENVLIRGMVRRSVNSSLDLTSRRRALAILE